MSNLTIKDIARICNVGTTTVSRAINNDPGIKEETKQRILETIREYNYVPNNSARNLKMSESNTIALLVKGIDNRFFEETIKIFEKELKKLEYAFILHAVSDEQNEMYVALELAKEKRLKGIIFLGGRLDNPEERLKNIGIPYVLCTVAVDMEKKRDCSSVSIDDEKESYRAVDYLCKMGHRRIAIIAARERDGAVGGLRLRGYERALKDNGIEVDERLIRHMRQDLPEYSVDNGYEVAKELLESGVDFTALYAISDVTAFGAYKAIYDAGKSIPEDYSVIGFDNIETAKYFCPALTTIEQPKEKMVKLSIELLMQAINGNKEKKQLVFDAVLLERDSVKKINN